MEETSITLSPVAFRFSSVLAVGPVETETSHVFNASYKVYLEGQLEPVVRSVTCILRDREAYERAIRDDHLQVIQSFRDSLNKERPC